MNALDPDLIARLAAGQPSPDDLAALARLARAGRLVVEPARRDRDSRDEQIRHIRRQYFQDLLPSEAARALADAWGRHVETDGPTDLLTGRPAHPDSLRDALRALTEANGGKALRWRQILNVFDGFRW